MLLDLFHRSLTALDRIAQYAPWSRQRSAAHLVIGQKGEEAAYFHLRREGYIIVARNYRSRRRRGEIDLIGWDGDVLCFVEVKTRTSRDVKPPEAAVDGAKRRELAAMARDYWRRAAGDPAKDPVPIRFDIVSIYYEGAYAPEITLFKNAFPMT